MALNPNWPVMDYATCWAAGPQQSPLQPNWCDMLARTEGKVHGRRGKQYEIDQVQSGAVDSLTFRNDDGALDPTNTSSPYNGYVIPYRLTRIRAQWSPTQNLLTQNQATAGEATAKPYPVEQPWGTGLTTDTVNLQAGSAGMPTIVADGTAFQGANVFASTVPSSATYSFSLFGQRGMTCFPGQQITASVYARVSTASVTSTALLQIQWVDASGAFISALNGATVSLASGATAAWTRLTNTATAPANAAGMLILPFMVTGPATSYTVQTDGWQYEKGAAASTFTVPGVWYPLFTGYVERWPQRWTSSGNYGLSDVTLVDLFAVLSQRDLLAPFKADLLALGPNFLYALDEEPGTTGYADAASKRTAAVPLYSGQQTRTITPGTAITSGDSRPPGSNADALTGGFFGSPGPVVHSICQDPPAGAPSLNALPYVNVGSVAATGAQGIPATGTAWTRVFAARCTNDPGYGATGTPTVWNYLTTSALTDGIEVQLVSNPTNNMQVTFVSLNVNLATVLFPGLPAMLSSVGSGGVTPFIDTDWHLFGISLSADGKTISLWCDESAAPNTGVLAAAMAAPPATGPYQDAFCGAWQGDFAFACELPMAMDATTWGNLYKSWRNGWSSSVNYTESSDQRYARILAWAGYTGPTRLSAGASKTYGPATDVAGAATLQALQNVVDTEGGQHFVAGDGAPVFQARSDRFNKTATVTFGENTGAGEIPYTDCRFDFDPTRIGNDVTVTQVLGNVPWRQQDGPATTPGTSQYKYGHVTLGRNVNSTDPTECLAAAQYLLYRNKAPHQRVESLPFDPARNPGVWPTLLGLELGQCAGLNRRPSNVPAIGMTGFVEQIEWEFDGDTNEATFNVQVSNGEGLTFWQMDSSTLSVMDSTTILGY